jgi:hypothetical protein
VKKKNLYWHFAPDNRKTRYSNEPIIVGQTLKVKPPVEPCERGLHASKRAIDALQYAPGAYVCLVTLSGEVMHGDDKSVASERTVIAAADATNLLFRFAIDCAARAMERCGWEHEDSWNALAIRAAHMEGLADDDDLSAARSAARSAAWSVAGAAARSVAGAAAEAAAEAAARSAAWSVAEAAAGAAAEAAAEAAERDAQNAELERRLMELLS